MGGGKGWGGEATANLHITSCPSEVDRPVIHVLAASGKAIIPWADIAQVFGPEHHSVQVCMTGVVNRPFPPRRGIQVPSIRNCVPFAKMLGSLESPNNHDVAFHFPRGEHLYADRTVLQRESPYFRTMLRSGFRESSSGKVSTPAFQSLTFEDSDADSDGGDDHKQDSAPASGQEPLERSLKRRKLASSTQVPQETDMYTICISDVRCNLTLIQGSH